MSEQASKLNETSSKDNSEYNQVKSCQRFGQSFVVTSQPPGTLWLILCLLYPCFSTNKKMPPEHLGDILLIASSQTRR